MENYRKNDDEKNSNTKTIALVIIIVVLLSLITSCSCTSQFFGKIGDMIRLEDQLDIDDDNNEKETIKNQDLRFDTSSLEIDLSDTKAKLGFSYKNINPGAFTCSTSDAEVATCYVNDDYVVINPKKAGNIIVTLQTEANGKIYQANAKVKISDTLTKYIDIEATDGVINLADNNTKKVHYTLVGLTGEVKATAGDSSIVSVEAKDGILKIKGLKEGSTEIKLYVINDGVEYSTIYNINVIKNTSGSKNNGGNSGNHSNNGNNGGSTNNGGSSGNNGSENTNPSAQNNTYLKNLEVLNSKYKLNKTFTKTDKNYEMTVAYNEKNLSFKATLDASTSKLSYKLNGLNIKNLNNLPLKDGDNILEIIVTSKSGKKSTYTVKIHKPIRTISLEHSTYNIILEESPYKIKYFVYEDGKKLSNDSYNINDIKASLSDYQSDCNIKVTASEIILTPNDKITDKSDTLIVTYNGKSASSKVNFTKYKLTTEKNYDLSLLDVGGSKTIILNTNLFTNRNVDIKLSDDKKILEICSSDKNFCVKAEVGDDETNLKLEYIGESNSPSSLPIKITASNSGISKIKITGTANGKQIADISVGINVVDTYILTLKAMEGVFNATEKEYQIRVTSNSTIDLTKIGEPYYIDDNCKYHKFKGYSKEEKGSIVYNLTDKNIVDNIDGSMTLYANYEEAISDELPPDDGRIVIRNIPLFHNEEYYQKYKKDKVIYPGAKGEYTIYLNNKSSNKINITGITLEEDTICIKDKGCLNMGYDIEYSKSGVNTWENLFGNASDQYWILNKNSDIINVDDYYKASVLLNNKIELKPNDTNDVLTINVKWKWVDDDDLDKLIGNKSAAYDDNINNMYALSLSVNYEIVKDSCEKK